MPMLLLVGKSLWVGFIVCWGVIRYRFLRRAKRQRQAHERDRSYEIGLLTLSFLGYLGIPLLYLATHWLDFADYPMHPAMLVVGTAANIAALWLFWRSHIDLGRNFSMKLVIREQHALVTTGVYRLIRHPMYASFLLWSVGQICLLPNWLVGLAGLFGFCVLYFPRVGREEALMVGRFGEVYREYMSRTKRLVPYVH